MNSASVVTLIIIVLSLFLLIRSRREQDVVLWGAVCLLVLIPYPSEGKWVMGVITPSQALHGFANEGLATIALLFIVAAGMKETGALRLLLGKALQNPKGLFAAQNIIVWPTAFFSAFLNNTPLVAMVLPGIDDWVKRSQFSISKILIPLSFASILGGACTLIGTSTNLIVNGWLIENVDHPSLGMFSITPIALPIAIAGILFSVVASPWLLPSRKPPINITGDARQYTVEMIVEREGGLANKTIEQAGLRGLPGLYLIEIDRQGETLPAVSANVILKEDDQLIFAGVVESVIDLQKIRGLRPATNQVFKLDHPRHNRTLIEAVVSDSCPVAGKSIRDGKFRTRYNAAVIAVARNGEHVNKKIGDIILKPGDTLLLEARKNFAEQQRNSRDFFLVSKVENSTPPNYSKAPIAISVLVGLVVVVSSGLLSMLPAAMLASGILLLSGCCSPANARGAIDWQVLLVIAAALAMGNAMSNSGLADYIGHGVIALFSFSANVLLCATFVLTAILACLVTSKTAALLMLPIAVSAANEVNLNPMPFIISVALAAATTVATPIGYPTNLMIFGPGGYRYADYLRMGVPITLITCAISVVLIPIWWPF